MELQPDDEPRSNLSIGPGFGRCSGISSKFARRFAEGIRKLAGNTSGDHRKKIERLAARMPQAVELTEVRSSESLRSTGVLLVPGFSGYDWILAPVLKPIWGL
ncbi:hypothetical protein BHE74_00041222 [Ensete ventricosum]|nr:hypothetical protein BHE74_00041222 [Ensete ventricosum]